MIGTSRVQTGCVEVLPWSGRRSGSLGLSYTGTCPGNPAGLWWSLLGRSWGSGLLGLRGKSGLIPEIQRRLLNWRSALELLLSSITSTSRAAELTSLIGITGTGDMHVWNFEVAVQVIVTEIHVVLTSGLVHQSGRCGGDDTVALDLCSSLTRGVPPRLLLASVVDVGEVADDGAVGESYFVFT